MIQVSKAIGMQYSRCHFFIMLSFLNPGFAFRLWDQWHTQNRWGAEQDMSWAGSCG